MPIYEYQCSKCGETFEIIQKVSDKPLTKCKFCEGKVERLISNSSFQLKGSGWYLTDYARKPDSSKTSSGSGDKSGSKAGESSKSETSKPDKSGPKTD